MSNKIIVPRYCSYVNCSSKHTDGILVFCLPKNSEISQKWKSFIKQSGHKTCDDAKRLMLCQFHFDVQDINFDRTPARLKTGSIPKYSDFRVSLKKLKALKIRKPQISFFL